MLSAPKLTPELDVGNLDRSLAFYVGMIGFRVVFTRPEDRFAYLDLDGVHLMLEELGGSGRTFTNAPLAHPYGRGINFQIEVADVDVLYASVLTSGSPVPIPIEERWYRANEIENGNRQFVVADPDGYLLRFFRPWAAAGDGMTEQLPAIPAPPALLPLPGGHLVPAAIAAAGEQAAWRFIDFFTANIRNPNTRRAYLRACQQFFAWCDERGRTLATIRPYDVASYIEARQQTHSAPDVKQQLAAIRMLFDWLVTGQVVPINPAAAVRGPKHIVKTGVTPVLEAGEWRRLLDAIPTETVRDLRDLRDRALIATLTYSFARIGAALKMKVEDLRPKGAGWQIRLHEKGGKHHTMPCHHTPAEALHAYIAAAGIAEDRKGCLFRTSPGHTATELTDQPMSQPDAWRMIRRRAATAGIDAPIGSHTFRATGITAYLSNGGQLEHAQEMAGHESPSTTKLYDRTKERLTQDEVERIRL